MRIGNNVIVIGAGNTAIDCATIAKRLGAARVTMIYRRSEHEVTAYPHEIDFIRKEGVEIRFLTQPVRIHTLDGRVTGVGCIPMKLGVSDGSGRPAPEPSGEPEFVITADQVVKAVGQEKPSLAQTLGLEMDSGYIKVNAGMETSIPGVFAGGDCIQPKSTASTVMAVQHGKLAAAAIHSRLTAVTTHG
jgi:glutamate synthase (NADPH/NADH) small chain